MFCSFSPLLQQVLRNGCIGGGGVNQNSMGTPWNRTMSCCCCCIIVYRYFMYTLCSTRVVVRVLSLHGRKNNLVLCCRERLAAPHEIWLRWRSSSICIHQVGFHAGALETFFSHSSVLYAYTIYITTCKQVTYIYLFARRKKRTNGECAARGPIIR